MAKVLIDSGPVSATARLQDVPSAKWHDLMLARRTFLTINLSFDCRCLLQFVEDAEQMHDTLGFKSAEAMIRDGYELAPAEIALALEWLKINSPEEPISLDAARLAAQATIRETRSAVDPNTVGRPRKGVHATPLPKGNSSARIAARLKRDHLEIAAAVERGEYRSMRAAGIAAGIVKPPTPLAELRHAWKKASQDERHTFLGEIKP